MKLKNGISIAPIVILLSIISCNRFISSNNSEYKPVCIEYNSITKSLKGLNKVQWGDTKKDIINKISLNDTLNELKKYYLSYSDLQIDNYIISGIPFKLFYIFNQNTKKLNQIQLRNKSTSYKICYNNYNVLKKQLINQLGKGKEVPSKSGNILEWEWNDNNSVYKLIFWDKFGNKTDDVFFILSVKPYLE